MTVLRLLALLLVFLGVLVPAPPVAAGSPVADDVARIINQARLARGMPPYAFNAQLAQAAQLHSDDLGRAGASMARLGHAGSDGSTPLDRIERSGYHTAGSWAGEIWANAPSPQYAFDRYWQDPSHINMILHPVMREFGIGVTLSAYGYVMVVDFGAQPNVLPVFINDGAVVAHDPRIKLTLTNEDAIPTGDGPTRLGRAISVQIAFEPGFSGAPRQPYSSQISLTLPPAAGKHTVYVKYADAQGRSAVSSATIQLVAALSPTPVVQSPPAVPAGIQASPSWTRMVRPTPRATLRKPTATWTAAPQNNPTRPTATSLPSATGEPTVTFAAAPQIALAGNDSAPPLPSAEFRNSPKGPAGDTWPDGLTILSLVLLLFAGASAGMAAARARRRR